MNPDVLLLLISLADEWEGKITGASQGGPVCCPATQELPRLTSAALTAADWVETISDVRQSAFLHVASTCQTTRRPKQARETGGQFYQPPILHRAEHRASRHMTSYLKFFSVVALCNRSSQNDKCIDLQTDTRLRHWNKNLNLVNL